MLTTDLLAWLLFAVLAAVAFLHLYWATGGRWPGRDEASLARTVVGTANEAMPPSAVTLVVTVAIGAVAVVPPWTAGLVDVPGDARLPAWVPVAACLTGSAVFGLRGIVGLTPRWRRAMPCEPFVRLNRRVYSPLCLALGAGFALVALATLEPHPFEEVGAIVDGGPTLG